MSLPQIIQGGMGVAVSDWRLARAVSMKGQLGVVSGTALDLVITRRLQDGDLGGHVKRALDHFPIPEMAKRIWDRYFVAGGKSPDEPYKSKPLPSAEPSQSLLELITVANFVEVFLAKQGHDGPVGINLLEKIQVPTLPSLYGAMLAGVDYVLMGAGIPRHIPGALDKLAKLEPASLPVDVANAEPGENWATHFDPRGFVAAGIQQLKRPMFLAIVSSASLAIMLSRKASGKVDGFVIEGWTAGGHNAPPRGKMELNEIGEPIYGERDVADLAQFRELGLPFWLAGSYGTREGLRKAQEQGAAGIQVGTAFAFCDDSGIDPHLKYEVLRKSQAQQVHTYTDPLASPTGFPFKVVGLENTLSQANVYENRERICDLGYLRELYKMENGKLGYRCPSEPIDDFIRKGGDVAECSGRKCICNGLMATVGMAQVRKDGTKELPIMTAGDEVHSVAQFVPEGKTSYSAADVIEYLLGALVPDRR